MMLKEILAPGRKIRLIGVRLLESAGARRAAGHVGEVGVGRVA